MRPIWRMVVVASLASTAMLACRHTILQDKLDVPGRAPSVLITASGEGHIVYIARDSGRLVHRILGAAEITAVSPANDVIDLRGENAPLLAALEEGRLLVVYPVSLPGGTGHHHSSELRAQVSADGGRTWSQPRRIDGDSGARSHNFADLAVSRGGEPVVSWLDSRAGQQGVQTAELRSDGSVVRLQTADTKTCQCCRTALMAASDGRVWLAYRDLAEGNVRNMAYAVSPGAGRPFAARGAVVDDHWSINGCPESGPRFTETSDGTVWLSWFDGRVNGVEIAAAAPGASGFVRRIGLVGEGANHADLGTLPDGRLVIFYEAFRVGRRVIEARVSDSGRSRWSGPVEIASAGTSPRYVRSGSDALLTYTTSVGGVPQIQVIDPLLKVAGR
jgi:hypothetical protein